MKYTESVILVICFLIAAIMFSAYWGMHTSGKKCLKDHLSLYNVTEKKLYCIKY
jgi:hypothetical protein